MVNAVIPHEDLESTAYDWAQEILAKSPTSIKMLKFAMNLTDDGMVDNKYLEWGHSFGLHDRRGKKGRNAFLEKRTPNFEKKWIP